MDRMMIVEYLARPSGMSLRGSNIPIVSGRSFRELDLPGRRW